MRHPWAGVLLACVIVFPLAAAAVEPVVSAEWARANVAKADVVFVDLRPQARYAESHVAGAVSAPFPGSRWRVSRGGANSVLPTTPELELHIGSLGIDNATHVVLVGAGASSADFAGAAHIYWTFKYLGHDAVSILDGGFKAYAADGGPVDAAKPVVQRRTFKATPRPAVLATQEDVAKALKGGVVVDYRPSAQYLGINKVSNVKRYGTVPGAVNVPFLWLTDDTGGFLHARSELEKIYAYAKVPTKGEHIAVSNIGTIAALGWFAMHEILGNKNARLYENGLQEWAGDDANPVQRIVRLD